MRASSRSPGGWMKDDKSMVSESNDNRKSARGTERFSSRDRLIRRSRSSFVPRPSELLRSTLSDSEGLANIGHIADMNPRCAYASFCGAPCKGCEAP
jgi:hypothetical protein